MDCCKAISVALVLCVLVQAVPGDSTSAYETNKAAVERSGLIEKALQAMDGAEEIVFVTRGLYEDGHYYANFGHWSNDPSKMRYGPGGSQLCKLHLRTKKLTVLLNDPDGAFRDPRVHYEGEKILFAYRKGGEHYFHLYEIKTDGTAWRQLTSGDFDDVDPAYLPDGGVVFVSSRCNRFVPCYHSQAGILYRMDADGGNVQCLSANTVSDHRPAVLPDGRIVYTRWEYVDRAPQKFHSLWSMRPDGTNQAVLYGNTVNKFATQQGSTYVVMMDAMPIPDTKQIVAVFSPGHGNRENAGNIMLLDLDAGPDDPTRAKQISPKVKMAGGWAGGRGGFRDPYPLTKDCFLVAQDKSLLIMDSQGNTDEVYHAKKMLHDPRVIRPRRRERLLSPQSDLTKSTGQLFLTNIYRGRNMEGVKPGEIKKLLVLEQLSKPISYYALPGAISMNGTYTVKRILGTVPVEPDGSASLEVPSLRALFFVALDEQGLAVKRMQSYTMVMPGETAGCVGCHEKRTETFLPHGTLLAMDRHPSQIEPLSGLPEIIDYRHHIQPIWDRHCVDCHDAGRPNGRVLLSGDYNEWASQSYFSLFANRQISDQWRYDENGNHGPRQFGSSASALINKIDGSHYDAALSAKERRLVQLWIDTGAAYSRTYATCNKSEIAVGATGPMIGSMLGHFPRVNRDIALEKIVETRCMTCHNRYPNRPGRTIDSLTPHDLREEQHVVLPMGKNIGKGRGNLPRHCWNLYNLSYPDKSMILLAPLAKEAGGYGWCKTTAQKSEPARIFRDRQDPDYQAILRAIEAAKARREEYRPFDMPGFRPNEHYVRWMKRFGVLPEDFDLANGPLDVYQCDEAYWRSLWYQPPAANNQKARDRIADWQSSRLDGRVLGVCANLKLKNPSFEEPEVRSHPSFRPGSGDVPQVTPAGWKSSVWKNRMHYCQGRCSLAPHVHFDGGKNVDGRIVYGPAATAGKQVAKMWVGRRSAYTAEDTTHAWLFQLLGTVDESDAGKTIELAVDAASRDTYPASCGELPKDGGRATATFALEVSEEEPGLDIGEPGRIDQLTRGDGTKTLRAKLKIGPELVGRELAVRLSIADPEPSAGYGCHYHFDNVRCKVVQ